MELRRVAERKLPLLVRSSASLRATSSHISPLHASIRRLNTGFPLHADSPAEAPAKQPSAGTATTQAAKPSSSPPSSDQETSPSTPDALDNLISSRLNFARGPQARGPRPAKPARTSLPSNSFDELLRSLNRDRTTPQAPTLDRPDSTSRRASLDIPRTERPSSPHASAAALLRGMPGGGIGGLASATVSATAPPPFRISPSLGRSVKVDNGRMIDLGRAFRMLDMSLSRNKVRSDVNRQRFHERPGLKRKRLRSERWRRRFKENFQDVVRRVQELKRKGW